MPCSDLVAYCEKWNIPLKQQPQTRKGQNMSNKHERELAGKVALITGGSRGIGAAEDPSLQRPTQRVCRFYDC
jgi:hypothetical protein